MDFISAVGREKIQKHEVELTEMLLEGLEQIPRVKTYGVPLGQERAAVVSFTIEGSEVAQIGFILDKVFNIAVRTGLHCAPVAHRKNGTFESGTVRVSPGYFTTQEDIRTCLKAIAEVAQGLA